MKTKGQIEAEISEAIIKFEREYMGRGPEETRSYLLGDISLVRLRGVPTPAEKQLADSSGGVVEVVATGAPAGMREPVAENYTALVLLDHLLAHLGYQVLKDRIAQG
ncbi:MAG: Na-translocating system protein MpsC family protein [Planctomycetota bacterium]|nr:Na-translocating system protein MpsC family protein [Planctomycetota bacterium]